MKLLLSITMHDEERYASWQLDNALAMGCYDDIVVLDDGSTDNTWDILKEYSTKFNNIHIYRNEKNSILSNGESRWVTIMKHIEKYEPTWINIRAADVIYPISTGQYIRDKLKLYFDKSIYGATVPFVTFWRSNTWYRSEDDWGGWALNGDINFFVFSKKYEWESAQLRAGMHQGIARPWKPNYGKETHIMHINGSFSTENKDDLYVPVAGLHYGYSTHDQIAEKFMKSLRASEAAAKVNLSIGMPPPSKMPSVRSWKSFNGYKAYYEFDLKLIKGRSEWFDGLGYDYNEDKPTPQSLYDYIKVFNEGKAQEYDKLFKETFKCI